ncbi:MAG: hypothetical protein P4L40_04575, partial [Terracidiphilus sp.]|nr:hypothetical protein [Terracidiphilus sp.]
MECAAEEHAGHECVPLCNAAEGLTNTVRGLLGSGGVTALQQCLPVVADTKAALGAAKDAAICRFCGVIEALKGELDAHAARVIGEVTRVYNERVKALDA